MAIATFHFFTLSAVSKLTCEYVSCDHDGGDDNDNFRYFIELGGGAKRRTTRRRGEGRARAMIDNNGHGTDTTKNVTVICYSRETADSNVTEWERGYWDGRCVD